MTSKSLEEKIELIRGIDFVPIMGVLTAITRFADHYSERNYSKRESINFIYMGVAVSFYNTAFGGIIIETCKAIYG